MKIIRSFSKKMQLRQYEPIESFCSIEKEITDLEGLDYVSRELDTLCRSEVERTLNQYRLADRKKIKDTAKDESENDVQLDIPDGVTFS